ncbi:hypothetical protein XFEB_01183 [Xylella fastidiosa EB92.1]|nr:hypothetical protein XFEB_01183 [Xylella fastidiosa EB92.1]
MRVYMTKTAAVFYQTINIPAPSPSSDDPSCSLCPTYEKPSNSMVISQNPMTIPMQLEPLLTNKRQPPHDP